ncbi:hypothetical protein VE03_09762 [Pseudogymnoascus sp. 23342-1-I1]|nr:hypothetical protein VE03_09762 [Pseudogymnoascus sp. 23342-1-I1]
MSPKNTFNVAVTGNPPFMEYDFNTSQLVRDALPDVIQRPEKKDIRILKYARDTRDTYEDVRRVSKDIWGGQRTMFSRMPGLEEKEGHVDVDLILHLGMVALGWRTDMFRFETMARRDGYKLPGDDGQFVNSDYLQKLGLPTSLETSFDVEAGWRKVKEKFPDTPSCVSDDAGLYFCEFRLYSSLAEPLLTPSFREKSGRVVFEHLPQDHSTEGIALARDITVTFVAGLVDARLAKEDEMSTV